MPGVPDYGVIGRMEDSVKGDCQFDNAEVWTKVTPGCRNLGNEERSNFSREYRQLRGCEGSDITRVADSG
jgi:hypothetical protein